MSITFKSQATGDLFACANVVSSADELDDLEIIALAQEEATAQ